MSAIAKQILVVGASLAGAKTAEALRTEDFDGSITLVGSEDDLPYERPDLSKANLGDEPVGSKIDVFPREWYRAHEVDLVRGVTVERLDMTEHQAYAGSRAFGFDAVVLTTGSRPRMMGLRGETLDGVFALRTHDDSNRLSAALTGQPRVVVVGAGWIGLEVAAAATKRGATVTVLARGGLPLQNVLGNPVAEYITGRHKDSGVDIRVNQHVTGLRGDPAGHVTGVETAAEEVISADVVVIGIGAIPNVELAQQANATCDDGVVVNERLCSSVPDLYAAGDIARAWHPFLNHHLRVEHWDNALHQPSTLARSILGREAAYDRLPYFFSDQFEMGMEYIGHTCADSPVDFVVRGSLATDAFIGCYLQNGRMTAAVAMNTWDHMEAAEAIIRSRGLVDVRALCDVDTALDDLAQIVSGQPTAARSLP